MSKAYQFPQDEPNPFADTGEAVPGNDAGNPYTASLAQRQPASPEAGYEQTLPQRGGLLVLFSSITLTAALLTVPLANYCLPLGLPLLAISIPALLMAHRDLKAMRAGAMDPSGNGSTRVAWYLAASAVGFNLLNVVLSGVVLYLSVSSEF